MQSRVSLAAKGISSDNAASVDPKRRVISSARKDPNASAASSGTVIRAHPRSGQGTVPGSKLGQNPGSGAAEQFDEIASPHSMTSSATASNVGGMARPSVVAVLTLMAKSNLV